MNVEINNLNDFKWDSVEQKKGYEAFLYWCRQKNMQPLVHAIDLFFIQKDHDQHEWWIEMMGTQIGNLNSQISILQKEILDLKVELTRLQQI